LLLQLKAKYQVTVHEEVNLFTIRHYTDGALQDIEKNKTVLIKQITPKTVQIITQ
jgi:aspartate kinase